MTLFNKLSVTNFTASTIPDDFLKDFAHHQKITRKWVRTDSHSLPFHPQDLLLRKKACQLTFG